MNYGSVAPQEAREIFVREALIEGRTRFRAAFLEHNRRLRREVEQLEAKVRRRDILVDEQAMCEFYLARLPADVHSTASLEKFLRGPHHSHGRGRAGQAAQPDTDHPAARLTMTRDDLMRRDAPEVTPEEYPDTWSFEGNELPIQYRFEPGAPDDGATVTMPLPLLAAATPASFSAPIAGWRVEKITETLRALPKSIRKAFVPVPDNAARAAADIDARDEFNKALAEWITRTSGSVTTAEELAALPLPPHLRFNVRVVDLQGAVLAEGRDLNELKRKVRGKDAGGDQARRASATHRRWDFGPLAQQETVERRGLRFTVYPTLRDRGDGVEAAEALSADEADELLRSGVLRLAMLALPEQYKYARKRFADERDLMLLGQGLNNARPLAESLTERSFSECFLRELAAPPRTAEEFQSWLDVRRASFGETVDRVLVYSTEVLRELRGVRQRLNELGAPGFQQLQQEVRSQLDTLISEDFPAGVSALLWPHLPRYLKALRRRLDKASGNQKRDAELAARIAPAVRIFEQITAEAQGAQSRTELDRLQWLIEELRVSLYAQDLRTAAPVSEKRVAEQVEKARAEARL